LTSVEPTRSHQHRHPEGHHLATNAKLLASRPRHGCDDVPMARAPASASTLPTESLLTRLARTQRRRHRALVRCFHRSSTPWLVSLGGLPPSVPYLAARAHRTLGFRPRHDEWSAGRRRSRTTFSASTLRPNLDLAVYRATVSSQLQCFHRSDLHPVDSGVVARLCAQQ
jgi:hypothetical protein